MAEFTVPKSAGEKNLDAAEALQGFQKDLAAEGIDIDPSDLEQLKALLPTDEVREPQVTFSGHVPGRMDLDDVEVSEGDKDRYFESVLSKEMYSEEVTLFDGKVQVKLRVRSAEEAEEATKAANESVNDAEMVTAVDYQASLNKFHLGYGVEYVKTSKWEIHLAGSLPERVKNLGQLPASLYSSILIVMAKFNQKAEKLAMLSTLPNFWQPVSDSSN